MSQRLVLFFLALCALACDPVETCRALQMAECPTPSESAAPTVGTPTVPPIGDAPEVLFFDPDPIVTLGNQQVIVCALIEDADQGPNDLTYRWSMVTTNPEIDVQAQWITTTKDGELYRPCWLMYSSIQGLKIPTMDARLEMADLAGNIRYATVEWQTTQPSSDRTR